MHPAVLAQTLTQRRARVAQTLLSVLWQEAAPDIANASTPFAYDVLDVAHPPHQPRHRRRFLAEDARRAHAIRPDSVRKRSRGAAAYRASRSRPDAECRCGNPRLGIEAR